MNYNPYNQNDVLNQLPPLPYDNMLEAELPPLPYPHGLPYTDEELFRERDMVIVYGTNEESERAYQDAYQNSLVNRVKTILPIQVASMVQNLSIRQLVGTKNVFCTLSLQVRLFAGGQRLGLLGRVVFDHERNAIRQNQYNHTFDGTQTTVRDGEIHPTIIPILYNMTYREFLPTHFTRDMGVGLPLYDMSQFSEGILYRSLLRNNDTGARRLFLISWTNNFDDKHILLSELFDRFVNDFFQFAKTKGWILRKLPEQTGTPENQMDAMFLISPANADAKSLRPGERDRIAMGRNDSSRRSIRYNRILNEP